ncbi:BTB/POZ domain-containing protein KCTD19-like [Pseudophryne corroboree]|uniref:BTB/POZ domain-containing protein KCTD19-like n=1 Tax=Pseudophryne corroboree TaxID=495146 RepID=UPI003081D702
MEEQALIILRAADKLQAGEPQLCDLAADIPITEKASIYYWKTRKCSSRLSEFPIKRSLFPGLHDKAPLGLLDSPLIDTEEEVLYCFFPIHVLEKYPSLVTDDGLLWFSDSFIFIECGCDEFRFIGNFLLTGKFLLPENFSKFEDLEAEIKSLGIPGVLQALRSEKKKSLGNHSYRKTGIPVSSSSSNCVTGDKLEKPLYTMALELLAKYPDSALGQLSIESSVTGSKLYITGTGTLFQHVKNWLGTCRLPLTCSPLEIYGLCTYLDKGDIIYQPMREAVRSYLKCRTGVGLGRVCNNWTPNVQEFRSQQIVRVYVGTHWYATHLKTLLKYPELLDNPRKTRWISFGFALLVNGDGQMFRHILNFLRLGSLLLPSAFTEWRLLCQEVNEFNIPSLEEALQESRAYRLWLEKRVPTGCSEDPKPKLHQTSTKSSVCDQRHRIHVSSPGPSGGDALKLHSVQRHSPVHKGAMQQAIPVYKDPKQCLNSAHEEEKATATTCKGPRNDDGTALPKGYVWLAMERGGPDDLGAILWVHHHHLVANDGSAASFQESILYTTEYNIPEAADCAAAPNDLVFLSVNMTYEEIFYARNCHSFLTGVILDSIQQGDPVSRTCSVMSLVSMLWDFQLPTRQFVDDLLTLESYRDEKSTREKLLCWLELTLPCARKFSQCIKMMLQKGGHRAVSCPAIMTGS